MANTSYKHLIAALELNATVVSGLVRAELRANLRVDREASDGEAIPRIQHLVEMAPLVSFESRAIATCLSNVGCYGKAISDYAAGLKCYAQAAQHGGTRKTGASHVRYTVRDGMLLPRRITADHRRPGTISYDAICTYDAVNEVVTKTESVALPSAADDERFGLGPIRLGGITSATWRGQQRLEIDFGIREDALGADGSIRNTEVSISSVMPTVTITGINPLWFGASAVPIGGLELGHADTTIYLRRYRNRREFWGDGEAQHVALTVSGLAVMDTIFRGQDVGAAETGIVITPDYDGVNDILKFATAQTIT